MTLPNVLRSRVTIQAKTSVLGALGETVTWAPVETRYARVVVLDAKARLAYQQLESETTHKVVFRGSVSLSLGTTRLLWKGKTLEPTEPPLEREGATEILVKEV